MITQLSDYLTQFKENLQNTFQNFIFSRPSGEFPQFLSEFPNFQKAITQSIFEGLPKIPERLLNSTITQFKFYCSQKIATTIFQKILSPRERFQKLKGDFVKSVRTTGTNNHWIYEQQVKLLMRYVFENANVIFRFSFCEQATV